VRVGQRVLVGMCAGREDLVGAGARRCRHEIGTATGSTAPALRLGTALANHGALAVLTLVGTLVASLAHALDGGDLGDVTARRAWLGIVMQLLVVQRRSA
jgi:hypothetical protein